MIAYNEEEARGHVAQAQEFLAKGREYLSEGDLHINYYELKEDLDAGQIGQDLASVGEMLDILTPLAVL